VLLTIDIDWAAELGGAEKPNGLINKLVELSRPKKPT
jgi:hypothetical protein